MLLELRSCFSRVVNALYLYDDSSMFEYYMVCRQLVDAPTPTHTPVRRLSAVHNLLGLAPSANHHHPHPDVESGESSHPAATNKPPSHHPSSGGIFSSIQSIFSGESSASRAKSAGGANGDMVRASEMGAELSILHRAPTNTTHGKVFFRPVDRLPPGKGQCLCLQHVYKLIK